MARILARPGVVLVMLIPGTVSLHVVFGGHNIPHPAKAAKGGEDAFFFDDRLGTFGLADGVGGSARNGVDPGLFSREVLKRTHQVFASGLTNRVSDALRLATSHPIDMGGSTTLVLGQLEQERSATPSLKLLNLGDSGAMLLRPSLREFGERKVLYPRPVLRTHGQEHGFNYPFQATRNNFAKVPDELDTVTTAVKAGDVLIAATDGVLDNLFDQELQARVSEQLGALTGNDPDAAQAAISFLAKSIAERASVIGNTKREPGLTTPFMQAAVQAGVNFGGGGKLDDIAIVCGVVRDGIRPGLRVVHNFNGAPTEAAPDANENTRDTAPDVAPFQFAYQNPPAIQGSRNNFRTGNPQFLV
jgi:protein phosphatase PTC7